MIARRPAALNEADVQFILDSLTHGKAAPWDGSCLLVMTVGLPGTGKSTFCRRLAAEIDAAVLESDALRSLLFTPPTHGRDESRRLFGALHEAARRLLEQGTNVIIDATSLRERDRAPIRSLAAATRAGLMTLYFTASEAIIEERLRRRQAGGDAEDQSTAGIAVYYRMEGQLEAPRQPYWRIDTSDPAGADAGFWRVVEACRQATKATAGSRTGGRS